MRKALCWLLVCLFLVTGASAEIQLVPQIEQWDTSLPMEITLSADVKTHMPFDENRCAQLNALLKHISLRLNTSADDQGDLSRLAVLVDGYKALQVLQKEEKGTVQAQLSWQPEVTFTGGENALLLLLGQEASQMDLCGFTGEEVLWLDDGAELMAAVGTSLEEFGKATSIKTAIKNMGTARKKITYTIPKTQTDAFAQAIAKHCPEGVLKDFLAGLTYSGQQKLILWLTGEGAVIRAEYAGKCGPDESSLRQVSLKWRMRRDDTAVRDDLTLKTPAVKGNDYNTVTVIRDLSQGKKKTINYTLDFSETVRADKKKSSRSAEVELTSKPEGEGNRLKGSLMVKQQLPGEDAIASMQIQPDLLVGNDSGTPLVAGVVNVQELRGKAVLEDADVHVQVSAGTLMEWQDRKTIRPVADLSETERSSLLETMSADLVPHLVLLPQEDTLYLSADLPEDVWQRIVEAARAVLPEEVTQ